MKAQAYPFGAGAPKVVEEVYMIEMVNETQRLQVFASNGGFAISDDHVEIEIDSEGRLKLEVREVRGEGNVETPGLARRCPDL